MVRHQSPALCCLMVHVGGDHKGFNRAFAGEHVNAFAHAMNGAGKGFNLANSLWFDAQTAIGKHGFKRRPNGTQANQARATGVNADHVVFIRPASHQTVKVRSLQGFVKGGFDVIGRAANGGYGFFGFGHGRMWVGSVDFDRFCRWERQGMRKVTECCGCASPLDRACATVLFFVKEVNMKRLFVMLIAVVLLTGCGYNDFQRLDEQTKSAWSEVLNQYQRRADLVPNIVATVKGEAAFEQETLTKVIEARSKATSIQVTPETLNDPAAFNKFQAAQGELGSALSRLMVVVEQYPNLKANQGFSDLRVQLEGTENRITVARNRYIQAVQEYNVLARSFPSNLTAMVFSYSPKANFAVQNEAAISTPPAVDFNKK